MKTASIESDPMMASRPASPKWTSALLCHIDNDRVLAVSSLLDHTASTAIFENFQRSPSRMGTYVFWAKVPPPRMAHRMGVRMPSWVPSWEPFVAAMRLFFLCRARRARVLNFIGEVLRPRVTRELDLTIAAARLTTEHCPPNQSAMRELGSAPALVPPKAIEIGPLKRDSNHKTGRRKNSNARARVERGRRRPHRGNRGEGRALKKKKRNESSHRYRHTFVCPPASLTPPRSWWSPCPRHTR